MNFSVMLDLFVAALLIATIVYAMLLSRRLGALRNDKEQLEALVRSLDQSANRAASGIAALKEAADQIGRELQQKVEQGQGLRSDLTYMIDLAGNLADRLETVIRSGRDDGKPAAQTAAAAEPAAPARRSPARPPVEPSIVVDREAAAAGKVEPRVTGFPSRAERLLRRALEARR
jgi:Domain of unknown function (DUF6468)